MPRNTGTQPNTPLADIRFRNGVIKRNQEPAKWNWEPLTLQGRVIESPYDIVDYQESKNSC